MTKKWQIILYHICLLAYIRWKVMYRWKSMAVPQSVQEMNTGQYFSGAIMTGKSVGQ